MIAFFVAPDKYPCPDPLRFSRMVGEHHLLIGGGVLDQPVIMRAVRHAGYIDSLVNTLMPSGYKAKDEAENKLMIEITAKKQEILSKQ